MFKFTPHRISQSLKNEIHEECERGHCTIGTAANFMFR